MKVVINKCYGGYSLSRAAVKRLAELQGRPCYFFADTRGKYVPLADDAAQVFSWTAFDVPNPNEVIPDNTGWTKMPDEQKAAINAVWDKHHITARPENRADPLLVQVVEELGPAANGSCAELKVVEIPDGTSWKIEKYDGREWIAETHRT